MTRVTYLTLEEIAAELRLTTEAVRRLRRRGAWESVRVGKRWLTRADELDRYIASLPTNPQARP